MSDSVDRVDRRGFLRRPFEVIPQNQTRKQLIFPQPARSSLSRGDFLRLSATAVAGFAAARFASPVWSEANNGSFVNDHIYMIGDDFLPVVNHKVARGENVTGIAEENMTDPKLIIETNALKPPIVLPPGQILKVPKYSELPMFQIPEARKIRHFVRENDIGEVVQKYGLDLPDLRNAYQVGDTLVIRDVSVPKLWNVETLFSGEGFLHPDVVESMVNRVTNVFSYYVGREQVEYLGQSGVKVDHGDAGFAGYRPPNHIWVPVDDTQSEEVLLHRLGHELWHFFPWPIWSGGADEGTAGFVASYWVTGRKREFQEDAFPFALWYRPDYYDSVNKPELRERVFSEKGKNKENRILATEAIKRIEEKYPGMIKHLTTEWTSKVKANRDLKDRLVEQSDVEKMVILGFGREAWEFINQQHILFTS